MGIPSLFLLLALLAPVQPPAQESPHVFRLVQMNGRSLPLVVGPGGACDRELTGGELRLHDGRYTLRWTTRLSCEDGEREEHEHDAGTYVPGGSGLRFRSDGPRAREFGGLLSEERLEVSFPEGSYLFHRTNRPGRR